MVITTVLYKCNAFVEVFKPYTVKKKINGINYFRQIEKTVETVKEVEEESPPAHRTRHSTRQSEKLIKTSDYSSEESLDRLRGHRKEIYQVL